MAFAALLAGLPLACHEPARTPVEPPSLGFIDASLDPPLDSRSGDAAAPAAPVRPDARRPVGSAEAKLEDDRIILSGPLELVPRARFPEPATRRRLDAVAELMRARGDILLLRIDAYSSRDPRGLAGAKRREIEQSQLRADAALRYLYKERGVSAERLEAVGHGFRPDMARAGERWPVTLRVAQWRR